MRTLVLTLVLYIYNYREYFYCVDWVHGCALHSGPYATCCEAHTNFADESACLKADSDQNEVVNNS
jgi:hypothetical protein